MSLAWKSVLLVLALGAGFGACVEDVEIGQFYPAAGSGGTSAAGGTSAGEHSGGAGAGGGGACEPRLCLGMLFQCGDCEDNDQDGVSDAADDHCVGPCDDTEDSFYGGIPGQNNTPCRQDCYFDRESGSGNDDCYWNHACDERSTDPGYPPSGDARCTYDPEVKTSGTDATCDELEDAQSSACTNFCLPLTPNGCDCFGCCELPARSGHFVWLGSTVDGAGSCDASRLDDPEACRPCTPVPSCFEPCAACEVCVGETEPDPSCTPAETCVNGAQSCGGALPMCPSGYYCITGCCVPLPK